MPIARWMKEKPVIAAATKNWPEERSDGHVTMLTSSPSVQNLAKAALIERSVFFVNPCRGTERIFMVFPIP